MMDTYKITFLSKSSINELPNSQTIFGAICNIILQTKGEEALQEYLNSLNDNPQFVHSSMFLNHTFPMIKKKIFQLDSLNELISNLPAEMKLEALANAKKFKSISLMSDKIFESYILNGRIDQLSKDIQNKLNQFHIDKKSLEFTDEDVFPDSSFILLTRNGFPVDNNKTLFYSKAYYYPENTEFCIYLKTSHSKEEIKEIFQYFEYFGIGNRRSIGSNVFILKDIEKVKFDNNSDYRLLLSRYIPQENEVNYNQSYYELESDIYRTSKDYAGGYVSGKYVHMCEGSLLRLNEEKSFYGKAIKVSVNDKDIYHYGLGFVV